MSTKSILSALILSAVLGISFPALASGDHDGKEPEYAVLGEPGNPQKVDRTVNINMSDDMRYSPSSVTVKQGETIRFVLKNTGAGKHEMILGTVDELKEHAALMLKFPEMEHSEPNMASVEPGKTGEMVWAFTKAGSFDFGCLMPGHYEGGMAGKVTVLASASGAAPVATSAAVKDDSAAATTDTTNAAMTSGEVKKIDKDAGKITIRHGALVNLGMPAMTMVFHVKDPAMLDKVKAGDKIKFIAEKEGGALTVTKLQSSK